ncbi:hypothetical protein GGR53DRAFT_515951 [Hypoxylon sp. FL1150]|nr:hypothetical protein GGR53DRAFT_515951 [Hypoxylon sp. FL1150]
MYRVGSSNSHRGSWRGQASRPRARYTWNRGRDSTPKPEVTTPPYGSLITEIAVENLNTQIRGAKITDVKYAASYSLVERYSSKILIPGQPATWKPPQLPTQLPPDHGDYLRDHNGARFKHPLQPTVQSLFALNNNFDPSNVDIMGCASSLGDILRFTISVESTFRFDVEMIGNTLFITRNHGKELIPDVRGYGHSFLDTFTSHEGNLKATESHQRIVSYSFGGLKCLLRFECDSYIEDKDTEPETTDIDLPKTPTSSNPICPENSGKVVSQASILEIKTRSEARGPLDMSEQLPRLWLRQVPTLVTAYHARGRFADVQQKPVAHDTLTWESEHEAELQVFAAVLRQLIVEVKRAGHRKLELCRTGLGPLELREQAGALREALPAYWKDRWAGEYRQAVSPDGDDDEGRGKAARGECVHSDGCPSLRESSGSEDEDEIALDYTACDFDTCGYCGHCGG